MFSRPSRSRLLVFGLLLAVLASLAPNPTTAAPTLPISAVDDIIALSEAAMSSASPEAADLAAGPDAARIAEAAVAADMASATQPPAGRIYPDTGHMLDPVFLAYYDKNSGTRVLGSPVTEVYQENGRSVQVFQRGRLEYDPGSRKVTPTALGRLLVAGREADARCPPPLEDPQGLYDADTGHSVGTIFAAYWTAAGAGATLGRPISEVAVLSDQPLGYVQYFPVRPAGNRCGGAGLQRPAG